VTAIGSFCSLELILQSGYYETSFSFLTNQA
jgi:hypothetical protein